ncbi:MAG TPA: hypothetical protein VFD58_00815 [Blastocatellia bacterium]|nr:hypothetical protein [Blastocatellia bacterium]
MSLAGHFSALRDDAGKWCRGRSFIWRAPVLLYLAWECFQNFRDPFHGTIFGGITLAIHEMGHVIFSFAGEFIMVAGGSLMQLAAPLITAFLFLRQRDYFGISVAGAWLSLSLYNLAAYIGDAQAQVLPLVNIGGGEAEHDWYYLLSHLGLLRYDAGVAGLARLAGLAVMLASLVPGAWLCVTMARSKGEPEES